MLAALTMVATSCKNEKQDLGVEMAYGHEYVDLGLPSGTLWATCNVGATNPWDYGDYFAWGETQPYYATLSFDASGNFTGTWKSGKTGYNWASYPFTSGSTRTETGTQPYNPTTLILYPAYDAARANWGGDWHMPTSAQISELLDASNCSWEWKDAAEDPYHCAGYLVTSVLNGNSIFLPAAGVFGGASRGRAGTSGYYWSSTRLSGATWSSTRLSGATYAYYLGFLSSYENLRYSYRCLGFAVRPVR